MPETKKEKNAEKNKVNDETLVLGPISDKSSEKNSVLFYVLSIITALLIVALIIGGAFFIAIKNNVNGIADNMRDSIDKIPVLRLALPVKPEPDNEKNMTEEQVRKKYTQLKNEKTALEKQISDLTGQVEQLKTQLSAKDTNSSLLQQQKDKADTEKLKLQENYAKLKKDFDDMSAAIAAGDTTQYKKYFEKIDPKVAASLYEKILKDEKLSADVKKYCSIYETMDASAVAGIMEQMGTGKMTLIIDIMKNLKKDTSAAILSEMTPAFAANVSERLAKEYSVGVAKATK